LKPLKGLSSSEMKHLRGRLTSKVGGDANIGVSGIITISGVKVPQCPRRRFRGNRAGRKPRTEREVAPAQDTKAKGRNWKKIQVGGEGEGGTRYERWEESVTARKEKNIKGE